MGFKLLARRIMLGLNWLVVAFGKTKIINNIVNTRLNSGATKAMESISRKPTICATIKVPIIDPIPPTITTATEIIKGATHIVGDS